MKRTTLLTAALCCMVVLLSAFPLLGDTDDVDEKRARLYIKVYGGGLMSNGGDFGHFIDQANAHYTDLDTRDPRYDITLTETSYFSDFGGEIGLEVGKHAVGLSAGYMAKDFTIDSQYQAQHLPIQETYQRKYTFSAIPIFLFIHYRVIDHSLIRAYFSLGTGVYVGRLEDNQAKTLIKGPNQSFVTQIIKGNRSALAGHVGVSIDVKIFKHLALTIDAGYRLAKFEEIKGELLVENSDGSTLTEGTLYYGYDDENVRIQPGFEVIDPEAEEPVETESLPAVLNLNGFSLKVGIKIIL